MEQPALFYESINDALDACVKACGGAKVVGGKLWPEKTPDAAHRLLLACLNESRDEKLGPDQVMFILKLGRERGFHAAMAFLNGEAGYEAPRPITKAEEVDRLTTVVEQASTTLAAALKSLERIHTSGTRGAA